MAVLQKKIEPTDNIKKIISKSYDNLGEKFGNSITLNDFENYKIIMESGHEEAYAFAEYVSELAFKTYKKDIENYIEKSEKKFGGKYNKSRGIYIASNGIRTTMSINDDEEIVAGTRVGTSIDESEIVLFFTADWCIKCKSLLDNIKTNKDSIPTNLLIVIVNFDKEITLIDKYDVKKPDTFVQINLLGEKINTWSGSTKVCELAEKSIEYKNPKNMMPSRKVIC